MDIEHELRTMDQARLTTDSIHFDSIEGQAWLNRVFQERLDETEVELFDTGVLKEEGASDEPTITTFVPPNLEIQEDKGEVVYLSRTRKGTMRSKLVIVGSMR